MMKNKNEMGETDIIVLDDDGIRVGEKPAVCRYGVSVFFYLCRISSFNGVDLTANDNNHATKTNKHLRSSKYGQ
jgi:hypothetical protein